MIIERYSKKTRNEKNEWVVTFSTIELGENCWIGGNNSLGCGVTIGKGSVVAGILFCYLIYTKLMHCLLDYSHVSQSIGEESFAIGLPNATVSLSHFTHLNFILTVVGFQKS